MDEERPEEEALPLPGLSCPAESESSSSSVISEVVISANSDSSEDSDDFAESAKSMLDFRSPTFSPILALKCDESEISQNIVQGAKKYLNLQQYSKAVKSPTKSPRKDVASVQELTRRQLQQSKEEAGPSSSFAATPHNFPIPGRRFLPHQMPVYRPRREHPNTITLMNSVDGPLSVLRRVMSEKTRVKIWTRNDKGFRGFLTGFVEAFDKHWNIALRDVDEQFVRKKVIKFPIFGDNILEDSLKEITKQEQRGDSELGSTTLPDEKSCNNNDDNEDKEKEQAIFSTFIRLKNYLRQNDGMTRKQMGSNSAAIYTQTHKNKSSRKNSSLSKNTITPATATKSKTVYVGDMGPLSICRTGLANLSLRDDIHHHHHRQPKHSSTSLRPSPTAKRKSAMMLTRPDIVQCHETKGCTKECSSSSTSVATTTYSPASTCSTQQHQQHPLPTNIISRTSLKKKSLTVFKTPYEDSFGFMVVAQTRKYELVERYVGQVLLMGNDIVFIETSSGC